MIEMAIPKRLIAVPILTVDIAFAAASADGVPRFSSLVESLVYPQLQKVETNAAASPTRARRRPAIVLALNG